MLTTLKHPFFVQSSTRGICQLIHCLKVRTTWQNCCSSYKWPKCSLMLKKKKKKGLGVRCTVYRGCRQDLCGVLTHLFNLRLHLQKVTMLWKTSSLVCVPKKNPKQTTLQTMRLAPVALTSHIMKAFERLLLLLQFAYQPQIHVLSCPWLQSSLSC